MPPLVAHLAKGERQETREYEVVHSCPTAQREAIPCRPHLPYGWRDALLSSYRSPSLKEKFSLLSRKTPNQKRQQLRLRCLRYTTSTPQLRTRVAVHSLPSQV